VNFWSFDAASMFLFLHDAAPLSRVTLGSMLGGPFSEYGKKMECGLEGDTNLPPQFVGGNDPNQL